MRPEKKKEKVCYNSVLGPVPGAHAVNNKVAMSSTTVAVVSSPAKFDEPSYNACPPPPNLYGPAASPAVSSPEKAKSGAASGNTSDGEKKGRRRPGRKSRQVSDSSAFPLVPSDSSSPAGKAEGYAGVGLLSQDLKKQLNVSSHLPSPNPSSMPNPSFRVKSAHDLPCSPPVVAKSTTRSETRILDQTSSDHVIVKAKLQPEQCHSSSKKLSHVLSFPALDASCTVESGGKPKAKSKETLPIGIPKAKSKDTIKGSKSNAGPCQKKSACLGVDSKQLCHKGWRMCNPAASSISSCPGSFDVPASSGISCTQAEGVGASSPGRNSDPVLPESPRSWPESSVLGSPAMYVSPDKFLNGGSTGNLYGHGTSRSSHFSEHLSSEEAARYVESGDAFRGVLRVNPHYRSEAYVTLEGVPLDILVDGLCAQNRAMEGDVVAVQLNPSSQWPRLKGTTTKQSSTRGADDMNGKVSISAENNLRRGSSDMVLEYEIVASGWDSDPASVIVENVDTLTMDGSPSIYLGGSHSGNQNNFAAPKQGSCYSLESDWKKSCNSKIGLLEGQGKTKEVAKSGYLDRDRSEDFIKSLAALVESMPGKRPTGRVVAILGKSKRREAVIGYLEVLGNSSGGKGYSSGNDFSPQKSGKKTTRNGGMMNFMPVDNRFSKMVVCSIPEHLSKRLKDGDPTVSSELVVVQVEGWKADSPLPRALVKQSLGPGGTIEAQIAAILFENAIHGTEFPPSCLACLPDVPWKIPDQELKMRKDLRGLRIFTIDPATAKDLDDALSIEQLDDGNVRVGVHIADVSFFVQPDTALDKEAQKRSTSVYLIQRVLPMLPSQLCEKLSSLNPGVDRLAFSVMWNIDPTGIISDQWIGRTIICSCAKLTYGHAQEIIDGTFLAVEDGSDMEELSKTSSLPHLYGDHSWQDLMADVCSLHEIAKRRRESRFDGGALKLENSKLVFTLDEDGEPYDSTMYQHEDSNFLVEEFMLLANMTVARVISSAFPERALLRRHPEPNVRKLREFEEFCSKNGFELDTSSSGALHLSLEKMRESFLYDPVLFNILMLYATKPMQLAKYFCTGDLKGQEDDWAHYALAVPLYTHFTSPIRRYPDLVVHRMVAAALEAELVISNDGLLLSGRKESNCEVAGTGSLQCFSGRMLHKDLWETDVAQRALVVAAEKHKLPELSELSLVAAHCNERRMASRNVKEASDKLYLWSMVKKKQGVLSTARVLALGPKFMSLYVCKIAMERRIYYDEIEGLNAEWFEATGTLVLNLSTEKLPKKYGPARGRPQRTVADVALLVNPTDSVSAISTEETYEDLIREVEDRLAGKIIAEDDERVTTNEEDGGSDVEVEPAVLPLTLRWFSSLPVSIHAIGGENRPLDIAVRLYVSSYAT